MRFVMLLMASLLAVPAGTEPRNADVEELLADARCRETPVSLKMTKARLGTVFQSLEGLVRGCPLSFEVAPDVASMTVSLRLIDAQLSTVLDVLAGNNSLSYSVESGKVRVRRKGPTARASTVTLEVAVREAEKPDALRSVRITIPAGTCGHESFVLRVEAGRGPLFRLNPDYAELQQTEADARSVRLRLCAEKASPARLELVGEATLREVLDGGYRSREERTVFRHSVGADEKEVKLFRTPDGAFEVELSRFEVVGPSRPAR